MSLHIDNKNNNDIKNPLSYVSINDNKYNKLTYTYYKEDEISNTLSLEKNYYTDVLVNIPSKLSMGDVKTIQIKFMNQKIKIK